MTSDILTAGEILEITQRPGDPDIGVRIKDELRLICVRPDERTFFIIFWAPTMEPINDIIDELQLRRWAGFCVPVNDGRYGVVAGSSSRPLDMEHLGDIYRATVATIAIVFQPPELKDVLERLQEGREVMEAMETEAAEKILVMKNAGRYPRGRAG
jgi:hypothetical protein